jgi:dethiobiotin synthase
MEIRCFVTGTDTDVGKTVVAAGLVAGLLRSGPTRYWKPIQSGIEQSDDTTTVAALTGVDASTFPAPVYRLRAPLSPHLAAAREARTIERAPLQEAARRVVAEPGSLVVEGAGGLLVPLAPGFLVADLVGQLGLPVVIVAHDRLGAINHTLLTVEACRRRGIAVLGVLLNRAGALEGNAESIESYGDVRILGRFPETTDPSRAVRAVADAVPTIFRR